jgi:DNA polymerase
MRRAQLETEKLQPKAPSTASRSPRTVLKDPETETSVAPVPANPTLAELRAAAAHCRACDLWKNATQTVFGEGKSKAKVMFVGEQPGDREDLSGKPFVGPAGMLLDRALEEAGIDRDEVYVTNAVKHFKWARDERGKRRIHKKPNAAQINACRPWLDAELAVVKPRVLVCLGATAAQGLLGRKFSVSRQRGELVESPLAPYVVATVHPSSLLRMPEERDRHAEMARFVEDLRKVARLIHGS